MIRYYKGKLKKKRLSNRCIHGKAFGIHPVSNFGSFLPKVKSVRFPCCLVTGEKVVMPVRLGWRRQIQ